MRREGEREDVLAVVEDSTAFMSVLMQPKPILFNTVSDAVHAEQVQGLHRCRLR